MCSAVVWQRATAGMNPFYCELPTLEGPPMTFGPMKPTLASSTSKQIRRHLKEAHRPGACIVAVVHETDTVPCC